MEETTVQATPTAQTEKKQTRIIFDIAKFALSILIVAIHTLFLPKILYPWLRIGVPLFFLISAYFLFSKINAAQTDEEKNAAVKKFCLRNLILYLFWFVCLLPATIFIRPWFQGGVLQGIGLFLKSLFFGSTFVASWFIMASVIATLLVFLASKKLGNVALLIISAVIYALVCLRSSYFSLFDNAPFIQRCVQGYELIFGEPHLSFPAAFLWIVCGKCFADKTFRLDKTFAWVLCILSAILLYGEWWFVRYLNGSYSNDCYFFLAPLCIAVFTLLESAPDVPIKDSLFLRNSSVIIYALHGTVAIAVNSAVQNFLGEPFQFLSFFITLAVCLGAAWLLLRLEKIPALKWLKYAH